MNKKAVSISILLLVISTLILSITSLSYLIIKNRDIKKTIVVSSEIDKLYLKESLLNFYLDDIFEKAVNEFNYVNGKQIFIDNFRKELEKYKDKNGLYPMSELKQAESINEENLDLSEDKLVLRSRLELKEVYVNGGGDGGTFIYKYEKEFVLSKP
ncbi:MAG: hypothetical protein AABW90_03165 [Nanoarchaeota archaeon]